MVDFLTSLGRFARVLWFDMRGIGMSEPVPDGVIGARDWVDDLSAVMDAAGFQRATVIAQGHAVQRASMAAATHPERIESLVLYNGFARFARADDYPAGMPASAQEAYPRQHRADRGAPEPWPSVLAPSVADRPGVDGVVGTYRALRRHAALGAGEGADDLRARRPATCCRWSPCPRSSSTAATTMYVRAGHGRYLAENIAGAGSWSATAPTTGRCRSPSSLGAIEEFVTGSRTRVSGPGSRSRDRRASSTS